MSLLSGTEGRSGKFCYRFIAIDKLILQCSHATQIKWCMIVSVQKKTCVVSASNRTYYVENQQAAKHSF